MADQSVRGQFVWHELKTPDANAAHTFYSKTIGWKSQPWEEDSSYVMFAAARGPVGATAAGNGAPPHWLPYIGTADIEQTVQQAQEHGGSVLKEIASLPSGSRYAVLQDPFGAAFGVYESAEDYGTVTPPQDGEHSWHELMTGDYQAAFDFYSSLFGWEKIEEHDMGDAGMYLVWGLGGRPLGGICNATDEGPPPSWLSYVHVKDVNQTVRKVKSAGGKVLLGPMEVPGGDWIVQAVDPQGALFAAHASAASMVQAQKKPKKVKAAAAERPAPVVEEPQTPAAEDAPPVEEAPAKRAPARKAPAKKSPGKKAPAKKAPARKAPARKAPAKKAPAKKAPAKKAPPAKKSGKTPAKKKAGKTGARKAASKAASKAVKKKSPAARRAGAKKFAAKKGGKKVKTRSGGNKKAAKKPRKGK